MTNGQSSPHASAASVPPTVLIGLGGTGREVLLRVRQRYVEQFGVAGLPSIRYIWIDCDPDSENEVYGKDHDWLLPKARLGTTETVRAMVDQSTINTYQQNSSAHPWLYSWILPQVFSLGAITAGASAVRPRGRLGFYENFKAIEQQFMGAVQDVTKATNVQELAKQNLQLDPSGVTRVGIVCSLAGGTGGGMFLDMAFLCRYLEDQQILNAQDIEIVGYLVMPSIFGNPRQAKRPYANAYAALKELEFYGLPKDLQEKAAQTLASMQGSDEGLSREHLKGAGESRHDFEAWWHRHNQPVRVRGPAFDYCYLVDASSEGNVHLTQERRTDLLDMVAETLFLESKGGSLSVNRRSVRDNIRTELGSFYPIEYRDAAGRHLYTDNFAQLYSSLGFSTIQAPVVRVRNACGYQLAGDIMSEWLEEGSPPANMKELVQRRLLKDGSEAGRIQARGEDYERVLDSDPVGKKYSATLQVEVAKMQDKVRRAPAGVALSVEIQNWFGVLREKAFFEDPRLPQQRQGDVRRMLVANSATHKLAVEQQISDVCAEWLEDVGVPLTVEYLRQLRVVLAEEGSRITSRRKQVAADASQAEREYEKSVRILASEENGNARKSIREWALFAVENASEFIQCRTSEIVLVEAEKIQRALLDDVVKSQKVTDEAGNQVDRTSGGLVKRVLDFQDSLVEIQRRFAASLDRCDRESEHTILIHLYRRGLYLRYYVDQNVDLNIERERLYGALRVGSRRLMGVMEQVGEPGPRAVADDIETHCVGRFASVTFDMDAIKMLEGIDSQGQAWDGRWTATVERFTNAAAPWMPASGPARANQMPSTGQYVLALNAQGSGGAYTDFRTAVSDRLGMEPFSGFKATKIDSEGPREAILYSERGAFPLPYVNNIEQYRQCFFEEWHAHAPGGGGASQDSFFPHITRQMNHFRDVCAMSQADGEMMWRANRALLLGIILGVVRAKNTGQGQETLLTYMSRDWVTEELPLGVRSQAVNGMLADANKLQDIEGRVNDRRASLVLGQRQRFAAVLYKLLTETYPRRWSVAKAQMIEVFDVNRVVIEDALDETAKFLQHEMGQNPSDRFLELAAEIGVGPAGDWWAEPVSFDGAQLWVLKEV